VDKVLFIDAHNAMWRACVSFGPPVAHMEVDSGKCQCKSPWNSEEQFCYGEKYGYVYNFFRNLRPLIEQFSPDKCFFVLEGHPQFRYDLFGDYKANRIIKQASRQEANSKFLEAKDIIVSLIQHLPITMCRASNYEADDVIGALCDNMKEESLTVISNDSDYIQLLQRGYPDMSIYNPIKKVPMEAPDYPYVAWKCLNGDKSDNIPALLKPKKALDTITNVELFDKFMSIEENRANFQVNRQLIEFHVVPEEEIILQDGARNFAFLQQAFDQMKFVSITNEKSWDKYYQTFNCLKY
jgi:5'-3' exonuclease